MEKCYPKGPSIVLLAAGAVLLLVGAVVLFVCIPHWAWCGLIGLVLIAVGLVLVKLGSAGR